MGWLVEPLKEVLRTIRGDEGGEGGGGGGIVRSENVKADLEVATYLPLSPRLYLMHPSFSNRVSNE